MSRFKKATREARKARIALDGPSGSGKTFTALSLARFLGSKIAVIDTEHSSANTYAPPPGRPADPARGWFDFDTLVLDSHAPQDYIDALYEAADAGFDVVIVDSLSHAWMGKGGILQQVDDRGSKFEAWKFMAPQQQALMEAILTYPGHVFVTLRTKTSYDVSKDDKGKTKVEKTGTAPVQKDGMEYEFDVVIDLDTDHTGHVSKTRCMEISGMAFPKPGEKLGRILRGWCDTGGTPEAVPPAAPARGPAPAPAPPAGPTPRSAAEKAVERYPSIKAETEALLLWDADDAAKLAELKRLCGMAARAEREAATPAPAAPAPREPAFAALDAEARKLLAASEHDDPPARAKVAELLQRWSQGRGTVDGIDSADLEGFVGEASAVLNGPAVAA